MSYYFIFPLFYLFDMNVMNTNGTYFYCFLASLEEGSRRLVDANVYGGEPRTDESLFTNKAFDDTQGGHTGAPSILPPRQRRLT